MRTDLSGPWLATGDVGGSVDFARKDFDDSRWREIRLPSHWRTQPGFETATGPLFLRRRFAQSPADEAKRYWLQLEGVFDNASVWLDGAYCGEADGYFALRSFEVTEQLHEGPEHVVAMEVDAAAAHDPWQLSPAGVWAPVRIVGTGNARISRLKVLCSEARADRAVLTMRAEVDAAVSGKAVIDTRLTRQGGTSIEHRQPSSLAAGSNRITWNVIIEEPELWWPWELGGQPLYELDVTVKDVEESEEVDSDSARMKVGLRHVALDRGVLSVNGRPIFGRGVRRALRHMPPGLDDESHHHWLEELKDAGVNLVHVEDIVESPAFYDAADRLGLLIWQDVPLAYGRGEPQPNERYARQAVEVLGHRPSVAVWARPRVRRSLWSLGTDSMRRTVEKADPTRPSVSGPPKLRLSVAQPVQHLTESLAARKGRPEIVRLSAPAAGVARCVETLRIARHVPVEAFIVDVESAADLGDSARPLQVVIDQPRPATAGRPVRFGVYLVNDLQVPVKAAKCRASVRWADEVLEWSWEGEAGAESSVFIGAMELAPPREAGELHVSALIETDQGAVETSLRSPVA